MPYEERYPKSLSVDELVIIHNLAAEAGAEATADILMGNYWVRRISSYPLEESPDIALSLEMYDNDWKLLIEAGVQPLEDDDPRSDRLDDILLPVSTYFHRSVLFDSRDALLTASVAFAERNLAGLQDRTRQITATTIGRIGLTRVNELLQLIGVRVDELGNPTYDDIEEEQLEGVRQVVRLMSSVYRDMVRMNLSSANPADIEAVGGTDIENPVVKAVFQAISRELGIDDQ